MPEPGSILFTLKEFASEVTKKFSVIAPAQPEAQLTGPLQNLVKAIGESKGHNLIIQSESRADQRIGIPDFAISRDQLLIGNIELKAPGTGANPKRFKGRNLKQWERFKDLPNIIYTDGNEWYLFQDGQFVKNVQLQGDVERDGAGAISAADAENINQLFTRFFSWDVIPPKNAKQLAELLAPVCRILRNQVADALKVPSSPLVHLANDWRQHLFPDASDKRFADAYAQTVTYALLLARAEGANTLDIHEASEKLEAGHTMLSRALQVMTDPQAQKEIRTALLLVQRLVNAVHPEILGDNKKKDPWLYFYEDFLASYDPQLRRDAGAYYTPVEVVQSQVRLVDYLLTHRLGKQMGFAEGGGVITLDPAVGTGTYLLGVIDHAMKRVQEEEGSGAVRARASLLWQNIHGFEFMVSPYAVAELRLTQAMMNYYGTTPGGEPPVYLTNTLESPHVEPPQPPLFYEPIAQEHHRALKVKDRQSVMVCIGNPPYDRHEAGTSDNRMKTGAWIRWGDNKKGTNAPLQDYLEPAKKAGFGGHLKNLYNLYIYFWRWAFWKVFEHQTSRGPGIISYISASSYLDGDAFVGMREHMRQLCDEIWIIDLGGEGRGTRKTENVFAIQTPVAIAIAFRSTHKSDIDVPAKVNYTRIEGTRKEKLTQLGNLFEFDDLQWQECPSEWQAPFRPSGTGDFYSWPEITDLMPWQISGAQAKRTWVISPERNTLTRRWKRLLQQEDRRIYFKETRDRKVTQSYLDLANQNDKLTPISNLTADSEPPKISRYAYRSFDRQWIFADNRTGDFMRPVLWSIYNNKQVYFTGLFSQPLGNGPSLTVANSIPDLDHFRGSYGAKAVIPLYRDPDAKQPNILPNFLEELKNVYETNVSPEEWACYLYGILAHPNYTERFSEELTNREVRVPISKSPELFNEIASYGRKLIWLHTYAERFVPDGEQQGQVPRGKARCIIGVPDSIEKYPESYKYDVNRKTLIVGNGEFSPVELEVWDFEVSGLKVVQSWLGYRMKNRSGKKSSPLDEIGPESWTTDFTSELLRLLWILEHTVAIYPKQAKLLEKVLEGAVFREYELPRMPDEMRKAPKVKRNERDLFSD